MFSVTQSLNTSSDKHSCGICNSLGHCKSAERGFFNAVGRNDGTSGTQHSGDAGGKQMCMSDVADKAFPKWSEARELVQAAHMSCSPHYDIPHTLCQYGGALMPFFCCHAAHLKAMLTPELLHSCCCSKVPPPLQHQPVSWVHVPFSGYI